MTGYDHVGIFADWERKLLLRHQLAGPDGRSLYQYRLTPAEFSDLERLLRECLSGPPPFNLSQGIRSPGFSSLFVLYAAEWWRRRFDGAHWSWEPILYDIGADPNEWNQLQRSQCVLLGFKEWGLQVRETGGLRFLGAVAVQGGLPLRLLVQARGKIGQLLSQILRQAGNSSVTHSDLLTWVESLQSSLPQSYRQAAIYTLLADVAWTILRLKDEANLTSSADAISKLDQQVNGWRERFPLPIEDVDAQGLIDQLVRDAADVRIERHALCLSVERKLIADESGAWLLQSNVALPESIQASQLAKLIDVTVDDLPRAGELALIAGDKRLATTIRRMAGSDGYRVERKPWGYSGAICAHEHVLHLSAPDGRAWSGMLPKGEALDEDLPWVFSTEESSFRFLRQGSGGVAETEALIALPVGWHIQCVEGAAASDCGRLALHDRRILRIQGMVDFHDDTGFSCRIRTGQVTSPEESYEWRGQRYWLNFRSPTMAFKGLPNLYRISPDGVAQKVDRHPGWSVIGAPAATNIQPIGPVAARYPATGEVKQRARLVALPASAALSLVSHDATSGDVTFDNWGAAAARVLTDGVLHKSRSINDTLVLSLRVAPAKRAPERVEIELFWPQTLTPVRLAVPFPGRGARAFDASGAELRSGTLLAADQLAGVRALMLDGGSNAPMTLEVASSHGDHLRRHKLRTLPGALSIEVRLRDYGTDIQHVLSADDSPDARVQVELRVGGSEPWRLNVARYAAKLDKNGPNAAIDDAGLAMLTSEEIQALPVMALRLERPGDEAIRLSPRTTEGVPTGSWEFATQAREPGCWLIYPGPDARLRFRPTLWTVAGESQSDSPLARAIGIAYQKDREAALDDAIEKLAADFLNPCWTEVEQLVGQVGHLALVTLDVWRRFARSPKGMAALAIRFGTLPAGFLDRFDRELPFAWETVPFTAWTQAMERLHTQCKSFGDNSGDYLFQAHLNSRIKDLTAMHGALHYFLGIASSKFMPEAKKNLPALRYFGGTADSRLFEGADSLLMRLRRSHANDEWPTGLNAIVGQARAQQEIARFLCTQNLHYCDGVGNLPLLLAAQVCINQTDGWFAERDRIHALREHRAFDPEWFDEAYNLTVARCLAAGVLDG
ncbi:MAG: STY4851/ECs_5259 family protein [Immundisolibacter sp.]|uniref:STY4851/ECs_5259 family protein n=1 Tax=Immundisolibacter sp. TaxID=1934948 RepID=UPI003D0ED36A